MESPGIVTRIKPFILLLKSLKRKFSEFSTGGE
jgi:hypothetical protein